MTLATLVSRLGARTSVTVTDPLNADLVDRINEALHEVESAPPSGWPWTLRDVTLPTVANQAAYSFDAIAALVADNDELEDNLYPVVRIKEVDRVDGAGRTQLERRSAREWRYIFPEATAGPFVQGYAVDGLRLVVYPTPSAVSSLSLRVLIGERDLVEDEDVPLMPARFDQLLLTLAQSLVYEQLQEPGKATEALARYELRLRRAMAWSRPYTGPGTPAIARR